MRIEIDIEDQIKDLDVWLRSIEMKAVRRATKSALNKSAIGLRKFASQELRKERKLKANDIRKRIQLFKAKNGSLAQMNSVLKFSGVPLPLILFLSGSKQPRRVTKRSRPLSFEVRRGSKKSKKGLYVAKAKHGKERYQVYRRVDPKDRSKGMVKQSAPSIAALLRTKRNIRRLLDSRAAILLQKNFSSAIAYQLSRLSKK